MTFGRRQSSTNVMGDCGRSREISSAAALDACELMQTVQPHGARMHDRCIAGTRTASNRQIASRTPDIFSLKSVQAASSFAQEMTTAAAAPDDRLSCLSIG